MVRNFAAMLASILVQAAPVGLILMGAVSASADTPGRDPVVTWEADVAKTLGLDARQAAALQAYGEQLRSAKGADWTLDEDQLRAMSLPARLDWMAQHATMDSEALKARAEAARRFYATLTGDQQKQFDELMLPRRQEVGAPLPAHDDAPPPPPNYTLPSHTDPGAVTVSVDALSRLYPSEAVSKHLLGKVLLHCTVDVDGYLSDCSVVSETPSGAGFGNAGLEATAYIRIRPATNYGVPVPSPINLPLTFEPP